MDKTMKTRFFLSVIFILAAYILGKSVIRGLLFQSPNPEALKGCIPPEFDSNYLRDKEIYITPSPEPTVIPTDWESVSNIPEGLQGKYATIGLVRARSGYDEFWIFVYADTDYHVNVNDYRPSSYLIFRTDTKQWRQAPTPPSDWMLFLDANNDVWATAPYESGPQLYRLDERANSFIPVVDTARELTKSGIEGDIKVASNGLFWFIFSGESWQKKYLLSFDPVTLDSKLHLTGEFFSSIAIDKNDNIYLLQVNYEPFVSIEYVSPYVLTRYDPSTGHTDSVKIPLTNDESGGDVNLYIDHEDRLWVSDIAWVDTANSKLVASSDIPRSPIFIHYVDYLTRYVWDRPTINLESIDGRLWYTFKRGAAWFKPDTKEWCWFARGLTSGPVADSENNLWMMINNTLYELRLTP
jgi:hypothetical protein